MIALTIGMGKWSIFARSPLPKPPAVLADRADQVRQALGYTDPPADRSSGFSWENTYLMAIARDRTNTLHWSDLAKGRLSALRYWDRTSPLPLVPFSALGAPGPLDPPPDIHGMTSVALDPAGQLVRFDAVPAQKERLTDAIKPVDWDPPSPPPASIGTPSPNRSITHAAHVRRRAQSVARTANRHHNGRDP